MPKSSSYSSKVPNESGFFPYTDEEHSVWSDLYNAQMEHLRDFACRAYLEGQRRLGFDSDHIPQVADLDRRLSELTGAGAEPVAAIIPVDEFATLLTRRCFPVATFIRRREHLNYIEEPDIFHEVFGHLPMLTHKDFCEFMEKFGQISLDTPKRDLARLYRLWWFTVEFGLIRENGKLRAFGAGIMSSPSEAIHASGKAPEIQMLDLLTVLRTPYRIDILQPVYFEIDSFSELSALLDEDIAGAIETAKALGDLPPRFSPKAA